ncbi:MAG: hypothetical protein IPK26_06755 [Planctomycetes bacterium]|nr:hypothetical protein [Planctomycetota bacterium]
MRILSLAALPFAAAAVAQEPVRAARSSRLATIAKASPNESVVCMPPYQRSFAAGPDGSLFVLIARNRWPDAERKQAPERKLELWRTDDGCLNWRQAATVPARAGGDGVVVAADRGKRLHLCWTGTDDQPWAGVCYQEFDPTAGMFVGSPVVLAPGKGEEMQYNVYDLDRSAAGALVATIGNHRQNEAPWTCGWSTGLIWRKPGATTWEPIAQVNVDSYGIWGEVQVDGALAHVTYRTKGWDPIIAIRSFDLAAGGFTTDTDVPVTAPPAGGQQVSNGSLTCVDRTGNVWVLYATGQDGPGQGKLMIAFARRGATTVWQHLEVGDDPPIQGGNYNYAHFTISHGPGNQVIVFWSKIAEEFATLYQRTFDDGQAIGEAKIVHRGVANEFQQVTGHRSLSFLTGMQVVVRSATAAAPDGEIKVFGMLPAKTVWVGP